MLGYEGNGQKKRREKCHGLLLIFPFFGQVELVLYFTIFSKSQQFPPYDYQYKV